jgi:hypothetical protein
MKIYHQIGHNLTWNIDAFNKGFGDGMIFSPINLDLAKLNDVDSNIKNKSLFDPQLYLLDSDRGKLNTYPYYPSNLKSNFSTLDIDEYNEEIAQKCVECQLQNSFEYITIPTRYFESNSENFLADYTKCFIDPFCEYVRNNCPKKSILLSIIVKPETLKNSTSCDELLNWITSHQDIDGVYLIFENRFNDKQIKDFDYLLSALRLIKVLKNSGLEVHIGYCNVEAILYALAMPDSVTIGSYENVRRFGIQRFEEKDDLKSKPRPPKARIYSTHLLQWVAYDYVKAIEALVPDYEKYFDESDYTPLLFEPEYNWQFKKKDLYLHHFDVFYNQLISLPSTPVDRKNHILDLIYIAKLNFDKIEETVILDNNSDGSHLSIWTNVVNAF